MKTFELLLVTMRPDRWWRHLVIFLPLLFTGDLLNLVYVIKLTVAFVVFSLLSGSISIIDDIIDKEEDIKDPLKRTLPVASGQLGIERAEFGTAVILAGAFTAAFLLGPVFGLAATGYFFVSLSYFLLLKNHFVLDALAVSAEISLCLIAGTVAISKPVSSWLLVFVMLVSVLLVFCERKRAFLLDAQKAPSSPLSSGPYASLLDSLISFSVPLVLSVYILYALIGPDGIRYNLVYTIPFAVYFIYRIFYLTYDLGSPRPLEKQVSTDIAVFIDIALWILAVSALMRFS
ncbi:MAG: UbiA family prenyltransferase [Candidatus Margulisiibacteriota bacterium]